MSIILEGVFTDIPIHSSIIYNKKTFEIEYQKLLRSLLLKDRIQKINKLKDRINEYQR